MIKITLLFTLYQDGEISCLQLGILLCRREANQGRHGGFYGSREPPTPLAMTRTSSVLSLPRL